MLHYDTQNSALCVQHLPLYYNKHIKTHRHTQAHTQTTPVVALSGKAHSLASLAPVLSGLHSKWPPHDHAHYGPGRQPLSGLRLPGCKQWFMAQGSVKEQPRPTLQPFMGTRRAEAVWQWGWIKSLATGLNPVETMRANRGRRVSVSLCVCVCFFARAWCVCVCVVCMCVERAWVRLKATQRHGWVSSN